MEDDELGYWLLSERDEAQKWRAEAPATELARALVRYRDKRTSLLNGHMKEQKGDIENGTK